jgi:hypothetical protein
MTMRVLMIVAAIAVAQLHPASAKMYCDRKGDVDPFTCKEQIADGGACEENYDCVSPDSLGRTVTCSKKDSVEVRSCVPDMHTVAAGGACETQLSVALSFLLFASR